MSIHTLNVTLVLLGCLAPLGALSGCSNTGASGGGSAVGGFKLPDGTGGIKPGGFDAGTLEDGQTSVGDNTCTPACPGRANAISICSEGVCGYACKDGFLDCDTKPENGCEVDLNTDPSHCGDCTTVCTAGANASAECTAGVCTNVCEAGWDDCDPGDDGCETHIEADADHCGNCTTVCPGGDNAGPTCGGGECSLHCLQGFADCDQDPLTGCEINVKNDPNHCGTCLLTCEDTQCIEGACACAATTEQATLIPLDLYIMMDQSGSMTDTTTGSSNKWKDVKSALSSFVKSPASAGIGVGIQYFPLETGGFFSDTSCKPADYAKPDVAISVLPGASGSIITSLANHSPGGGTPTGPALQGAINYAKTWAGANPTHTVVVVLATDGDPSECSPQDIPGIAKIASAAATGTPKVLTFVIGVGNLQANLNQLAAAGGTGTAFSVDANKNVVAQFEAALKAIQGKALGCSYSIPVPKDGQPVDFTKVNVQVTLAGTANTVLYVDTAAKCDPVTGGWHYDDAAKPTKILLCPATCDAVGKDEAAKVDILLGCSRETGTP